MDGMGERPAGGRGYFLEEDSAYQPSGLQNILKKIPVSSIFPNSSRRGRKANQPRKRSHPVTMETAAPQGQDYAPTSLQPHPGVLNMAASSPQLLPDHLTNKKITRRTSELSQQRQASVSPRARSATQRKEMSEKILSLTMEIISVLAGEECTVVTKSGEPVSLANCPLVTGGPILALVAQSLKQEKQSEQRILDLTFKIIQLLTGEVPGDGGVLSSTGKGRKRSPYRSVIVERERPSTSRGLPFNKSSMLEEGAPGDRDVYEASEDLASEIGMITETGTYAQSAHTPYKGQNTQNAHTPYKGRNTKEEASGSDTIDASADFTAIRVKEESTSCEDGGDAAPFLSIKIKEESVSDQEEEHAEEDEAYSAPPYKKTPYSSSYHTEDSDSGEGDNDSTMFAPSGLEQYAPAHSEPAPILFPSSSGPVDFLGFDDNSNLDTDVSALIKHAHTKFTFAPIEGESGSEEDDPLPDPDLQPPKDNVAQKSAPSNEEPAHSCEEGPSEEVTSTKKDRGMKTYTCSECSECFVRRSDFANHRRDHRRERLTCPECGKVFANKPSLLNHLTGHTGEKPYSCPVCGKCFTRNSNLIVHQATHMERSPFTALNVGDVLVNQIL